MSSSTRPFVDTDQRSWSARRELARSYAARPVEVTVVPGYVNYTKYFGDAEFIWTHNIRLDDLVLARYTAKGPRR